MGALFPLPRVIYSMAKDGIIFKFLAKIHPRFQTPVIGTFVAGICTGKPYHNTNKITHFFYNS